MKLLRFATTVILMITVVVVARGQATATTKPNIVFILTDNLGYGELGVYGGGILRGAPTPRIDKLAAEGTRLLNFNVEAQCTPSRSPRRKQKGCVLRRSSEQQYRVYAQQNRCNGL